ncbi:unnamed protein product [Ectocarpus fasciculatus]
MMTVRPSSTSPSFRIPRWAGPAADARSLPHRRGRRRLRRCCRRRFGRSRAPRYRLRRRGHPDRSRRSSQRVVLGHQAAFRLAHRSKVATAATASASASASAGVAVRLFVELRQRRGYRQRRIVRRQRRARARRPRQQRVLPASIAAATAAPGLVRPGGAGA